MSIDFEFNPFRLKAMVAELEKRIGVATGEPIRLDFERYLNLLRKYHESRKTEDIPTLPTIERLSFILYRVNEEELLLTYIECLEQDYSTTILKNLLDYYFDNYELSDLASFLNRNISKKVLDLKGWKLWSSKKDVFFQGNVVRNIAKWIIDNHIEISEIPEEIGILEPKRIREDAFTFLCDNESYLTRYLNRLSLESILSILRAEQLQRLHSFVWDRMLPIYCQEAVDMKIESDQDHSLFSLAKLKLKPIKSPQWLRLNQKAQNAYQEWALGSKIESFFSDDTGNERVKFWKTYLRYMEAVQEITHRGDIAACCMTIGKYDFIEFKVIGAIYVYPRKEIWIPKHVRNLDRELKFRTKVVNADMGYDNGEGWIPHRGRVWPYRAQRLIKQALQK